MFGVAGGRGVRAAEGLPVNGDGKLGPVVGVEVGLTVLVVVGVAVVVGVGTFDMSLSLTQAWLSSRRTRTSATPPGGSNLMNQVARPGDDNRY
jgi:hypothetical protein